MRSLERERSDLEAERDDLSGRLWEAEGLAAAIGLEICSLDSGAYTSWGVVAIGARHSAAGDQGGSHFVGKTSCWQ